MSKIADVTFTGSSGTKYSFGVYPTDTFWNEVGAVYVFSKRVVSDGKGSHTLLYIGETENLKNRIPNHEKWNCANSNGVNCICVHVDEGDSSRLSKETDLRNAYNTPCNDQ